MRQQFVEHVSDEMEMRSRHSKYRPLHGPLGHRDTARPLFGIFWDLITVISEEINKYLIYSQDDEKNWSLSDIQWPMCNPLTFLSATSRSKVWGFISVSEIKHLSAKIKEPNESVVLQTFPQHEAGICGFGRSQCVITAQSHENKNLVCVALHLAVPCFYETPKQTDQTKQTKRALWASGSPPGGGL